MAGLEQIPLNAPVQAQSEPPTTGIRMRQEEDVDVEIISLGRRAGIQSRPKRSI